MDMPVLLARIAGVLLFAWTVRSIVVHFKRQKIAAQDSQNGDQSVSEQVLNNVLLYLWLAFMIAFSIGLIVNN
jgi:hypothetical protein